MTTGGERKFVGERNTMEPSPSFAYLLFFASPFKVSESEPVAACLWWFCGALA